jgi:hypothetical protein
MSEIPRIAKLEASIAIYEQTIARFERAAHRLRNRRKSAADSVMVLIDERLALNQRTLVSLKGVLATARMELEHTRRVTKNCRD